MAPAGRNLAENHRHDSGLATYPPPRRPLPRIHKPLPLIPITHAAPLASRSLTLSQAFPFAVFCFSAPSVPACRRAGLCVKNSPLLDFRFSIFDFLFSPFQSSAFLFSAPPCEKLFRLSLFYFPASLLCALCVLCGEKSFPLLFSLPQFHHHQSASSPYSPAHFIADESATGV